MIGCSYNVAQTLIHGPDMICIYNELKFVFIVYGYMMPSCVLCIWIAVHRCAYGQCATAMMLFVPKCPQIC